MPYEVGGRADKLGNRYEGRWVVKELLRLLNEEIASVTVEAIGEEEEGVDLWVKNRDGSLECHQCKARNGSKEYWDLSDLAARGIFKKAKKQLDSREDITYYLVSAVSGMMLNDLIIRSKTSNGNSEDFYKYQIEKSGKEVSKAFKRFVRYLELDINSKYGRQRAYQYLKKMNIVQFPDDIETKRNLIETIKYLFTGNTETIYNILLSYVIENDMLGREITPYILINYLENQSGISFRQLHKDNRIIPRLEYLNNEFTSSFLPINNSIIHRTESEECYREILNGTSIIIHGKAGSGKSGCVLELINQLKKDNIIHLSLKLDRRTPEHTSEMYGQSLGLPTSPVYCIDAVSKDKKAVLILDQLDAIRWTSNHSRTALEVCKEMIYEVDNINKNRKEKIVLVFVCRTFDFNNDNGIKQLFSKSRGNNGDDLWREIPIGELNDENVKSIVGKSYTHFSRKLKILLKTPSNLYIWSNLEEKRRNDTYLSSSDLIKQWWEQLRYSCEIKGVSSIQLNELKDAIVNSIDRIGRLMIPEQLVRNYSKLATDQLQSNGLLISDGKSIGFVHQSFYDYFLVEKMLQQIYEGVSIVNIIGPKAKQTPSKRYQLQMLFENLLEYDMDYFVNIGFELLQNENIRFYMKYVFLEVLGQADNISLKTGEFIKQFINNEYWKDHLIDAVFYSHPIYIMFLICEGYIPTWLRSEQSRDLGLKLLQSVNTELPDEISSLLYPFAFKDTELDHKIYSTLCWNIEDDSDNMFKLRLDILKARPQLRKTYIFWKNIIDRRPDRALELFDMLVKNADTESIGDNLHLDKKAFQKFIQIARKNSLYVWEKFMPFIAESTRNITSIYDPKLELWECRQYTGHIHGRLYIKMITASAQKLISDNPQAFLQLCEPYYDNPSPVVIEVLLNIMENLPSNFSDYAINWLLEKPNDRFFNYTGENDEYLYSAKKIIEKHSQTCTDNVFRKLENVIYYFHEEKELDLAKYRFNFNKEKRKSGSRLIVYWPYLGEVQYYLIKALDDKRISQKTLELEKILNRKFKDISVSSHTRNKVTTGFVGSTIGSKADRISDKQWLRIIENRKEYRHDKWPSKDGPILESSPEQFSRDLERVGKKDPNRIASLSLKLSEKVDNHYISAILNIIGETKPNNEITERESWKPVNIDVAQHIFIKFKDRIMTDAALSFCRTLRNRAGEDWNDEVLSIISNIAKMHSNPEEGKWNVWSSEDKEGKTVEMLLTNSINCVRGCAAEAIGALLWEDKRRYSKLKDTVKSIVNDQNLAVNVAAIECMIPIMNIDRPFATKCFFELANKDIRIVASPYAYNLFYYLFEGNSETIKKLVVEMYKSGYEDVSKIGARHVANMSLLYGCFEDIIFRDARKTKVQKKGIIEVTVDLMRNQEFHVKGKEVIAQFLDEIDEFSDIFSRLLYKKAVSVEEDLKFILKLVKSKKSKSMVRSFINFMNENDISVGAFKDIILGMCQNLVQNMHGEVNDVRNELYGIAPELSRLIALLYDRTRDNFEVNQQCLDMWDLMFENRIGTVRELSKEIIDI